MATDKRVRYTKMFLKESLIKFMKEKPISRITIKELCEDAEINRATYYAHYRDQYDQMKQIEQEFIDSIVGYVKTLTLDSGSDGTERVVREIMGYVYENGDMVRVLLGKNGDIDFQDNIIQILKDAVFSMWGQRMDSNYMEYLYTYVATGSVGVIKRWLMDEEGQLPAAEVAKLLLTFIEQGLPRL